MLLGAVLLPVAALADGAGLRVTESGVGTAVVDRQLEGRAASFVEGTKVFFWTRVEGGSPGDRIHHVWMRDGKEISIGLGIGGAHWRTHSTKTLHPGSVGTWAVEARDADGKVLARAEFVCVSGEDEAAADTS
jgi:hypothetical protein